MRLVRIFTKISTENLTENTLTMYYIIMVVAALLKIRTENLLRGRSNERWETPSVPLFRGRSCEQWETPSIPLFRGKSGEQ